MQAVAQWLLGRRFAPLALACALGAALALLFPCSVAWARLALLLWLGVALGAQRRPVWRRLALGVAVALVTLLRVHAMDQPDVQLEQWRQLDRPRPRTALPIHRLRALAEPEWTAWGWRVDAAWLARCDAMEQPPRCEARRGVLRVTVADQRVPLRYGEVFRAPGLLTPPPGYRNLGTGDLARRWRWDGRVGVLGLPDASRIHVETAAAPEVLDLPFLLWAAIGRLRRQLGAAVGVAVPVPEGALTTALALGDRRGESPELEAWFRQTGTAHVMAVSGSHLALVVLATRFALGRLLRGPLRSLLRRRPLRVWLVGPCVAMAWGYAALTGGAPSSLRAAWMVSGLLVGQARGGQLDIAESLGFSALTLLLWDPLTIADAGWLLSVSGVLGLVWSGSLPVPEGWRGWLLGAWRASLGPAALTAGIALVTFGQMPLTGPIANLPVAPYASLMLPVALLVTLVAGIWMPTGPVPWLQSICEALFWPLQWLAKTPAWLWPAWQVHGWPGAVVGVAVAATLALWWHGRRWLGRAALAWLCALAAITADRALLAVPDGEAELRLLDVGHGQAGLIRTGAGHNVLVDGGGEVGDDGRTGERAVVPVLRRLGIDRLDVMALSHAHPDHENGLLAVARHVRIGEFWWNGQMPGGKEHPQLMQLLTAGGTRWRDFRDGLRSFALGELTLALLWPRPPHTPYDRQLGMNDNSLVLLLVLGSQRVLLPGDVEHEAELALAGEGRLPQVGLLASPHHGSRTSSTLPFLQALQPGLAVAGARSWGTLVFPHPEVVSRHAQLGIHLWSTQDGEVVVRIRPDQLQATQGNRVWTLKHDPPQPPATTPLRAQ